MQPRCAVQESPILAIVNYTTPVTTQPASRSEVVTRTAWQHSTAPARGFRVEGCNLISLAKCSTRRGSDPALTLNLTGCTFRPPDKPQPTLCDCGAVPTVSAALAALLCGLFALPWGRRGASKLTSEPSKIMQAMQNRAKTCTP